MNPIPELTPHLKQLRLSGILDSLEARNREAIDRKLAYTEFLALLIADEVARREQKKLSLRLRRANFRSQKTLEGFDFERLPGLNRALVHDLATGRFIEERVSVLIAGPCGTGKSHLAQALGHAAARQGFDVLFTTQSQLLASLKQAQAVGSFERRLPMRSLAMRRLSGSISDPAEISALYIPMLIFPVVLPQVARRQGQVLDAIKGGGIAQPELIFRPTQAVIGGRVDIPQTQQIARHSRSHLDEATTVFHAQIRFDCVREANVVGVGHQLQFDNPAPLDVTFRAFFLEGEFIQWLGRRDPGQREVSKLSRLAVERPHMPAPARVCQRKGRDDAL